MATVLPAGAAMRVLERTGAEVIQGPTVGMQSGEMGTGTGVVGTLGRIAVGAVTGAEVLDTDELDFFVLDLLFVLLAVFVLFVLVFDLVLLFDLLPLPLPLGDAEGDPVGEAVVGVAVGNAVVGAAVVGL